MLTPAMITTPTAMIEFTPEFALLLDGNIQHLLIDRAIYPRCYDEVYGWLNDDRDVASVYDEALMLTQWEYMNDRYQDSLH